jgi:hypothetical protein
LRRRLARRPISRSETGRYGAVGIFWGDRDFLIARGI